MSKQVVVAGSLSRGDIFNFIEARLRPLLPTTLPLYRRCQFHLEEQRRDTGQNTQGDIWVGVLEDGTNPLNVQLPTEEWLKTWSTKSCNATTSSSSGDRVSDGIQPHDTWLAAHIDLSNPGETQVWLFGSWEADIPQTITTSDQNARSSLFHALYNHIRSIHLPQVPTSPTKRWQTLLDSGKIVSVPYKRSKLLFGAISDLLWPYLEDEVIQGRSAAQDAEGDAHAHKQNTSCRTRQDLGYLKYVIPPPSSPEPKIPSDFRFGELSDHHLQLMLDRTAIPRTLETLRSLVSIGIFTSQSKDPVAWGMLGKDASISSLHTEPAYRGNKLAEHICRKLGTLQNTVFNSTQSQASDDHQSRDQSEENLDYSRSMHADVSESNIASRRVCEKLGGIVRWKVGWIEVDIGESLT